MLPQFTSRRNFLTLSAAALAAATVLPPQRARAASPARKKYPIGLELYSVRKALAADLPGTLRQVAAIGYSTVEFFAPYSDWTIPYAKEVRLILDDAGLRCRSTHNHFESFVPGPNLAKTIELNQILGTTYLMLASAPASAKGVEGWKHLCADLTAAVANLQPHGLTAGYHNHNAEWVTLPNGQRIMDLIAANTPREFILQFDVGTCVAAGADPVAWIKSNPGRIKSVHLKDWAPGTLAEEKSYRVLFGEGVCPWPEILAAAESTGGVEYYLMEQEGSRYPELETAARCLTAWRALRDRT
jgi:sugar phosphate isomerase/epimerase